MNGKSHWTRTEAERCIGEVLDSARAGVSQTIVENDGEFVVRFVPKKADVESAARVLARGGPKSD